MRDELPDIDIDVESARREDVYDMILSRHGEERAACVAMIDTYRARSAIREVGKALGLPEVEVGVVAKAFPHISARHMREGLERLPELQGLNLPMRQLELLFRVAERLDGFPRHIALHPCGIVLASPRPRASGCRWSAARTATGWSRPTRTTSSCSAT